MGLHLSSAVHRSQRAGVLTYFAGTGFFFLEHLFVLQTIIVLQRKHFSYIDFAFLRNCFLSCASNTINQASYEMCMRKIPCAKNSVSTSKSSNSVKFQFSHVFCWSRIISPEAEFFLPEPELEVKNPEFAQLYI